MTVIHKILDITVVEHRKDGGRITITTSSPDRVKDRVFPTGAKLENYLKNPVVLWGHDAYSAASLIGRTKTLESTETGIVADFELRPAANEADPQNIVLLLWEQEFVRASSIGFWPSSSVPNDLGGMDFVAWELLEFSLCSVPMNPDALRLAAKSFPRALEAYERSGARHSQKDQADIQSMHDICVKLGAECPMGDEEGGKAAARALQVQVKDLQFTLDALLAQRQPPTPEPIDDDEQALLIHLNRISALRH